MISRTFASRQLWELDGCTTMAVSAVLVALVLGGSLYFLTELAGLEFWPWPPASLALPAALLLAVLIVAVFLGLPLVHIIVSDHVTAAFDQGRVQAQQFDRRATGGTCRSGEFGLMAPRRHDDQRHFGRPFPQGLLGPPLLLAQEKSVIGKQHDPGVIAMGPRLNR